MSATVYLGLGSNLGRRRDHLRQGVRALVAGGVEPGRLSSVVETPPLGYEDQPAFLNLVMEGRWGEGPGPLLELMMDVESREGRVRSFPNAPRTLDVDLLFFGRRIIRAPGLRVPHLRWRVRSFVARPLAEIAPDLVDPETGWRVEEVARTWPMEPEEVRLLHDEWFDEWLEELFEEFSEEGR